MRRHTGIACWIAMIVMAATVLTGCDGGPSPDHVKADLISTLATSTPIGLLTLQSVDIVSTARTGNAAAHGQRVIHFVALVQLNRDVNFGAWDQFSAAALANAVGAAPEDIGGISNHSNLAGDVITIPGAAVYDRDTTTPDEPWRLAKLQAPPGPPAKAPSSLTYIHDLATAAGSTPSFWRILFDNLDWPPTHALALMARANGGYAISSGTLGSDRWKVVEALRRGDDTQHPVVNIPADEPVENIRMVRDGTVTAAIVDSDAAQLAAEGNGAFAASGPYDNLRSVANLYPKPVHVIVGENNKANSVADLRGKHIVIVTAEPGAQKIAEDVLRAHRLPSSAPETTVTATLDEALTELTENKADAVITTVAAPHHLIASTPYPLRLLSLDSDAIALLTTGETHYLAISIPGRTYRGQQNAVATVAVTAVMVTDRSVPDAEITSLLQSLFGPMDYMRQGSTAGTMISAKTAQLNLPLQLHPAAASYYKSLMATP